jgi:hypothetical protein
VGGGVSNLSRELNPLTPPLSTIRAFTPVFDGLWGEGADRRCGSIVPKVIHPFIQWR